MISFKPNKSFSKLQDLGCLEPNLTHDWLIIKNDNNEIGLFEIQPLTKITGILHLHIIEKYQNQGLAIKAFNKLLEFLKDSPYKQLIGSIPIHNKKILSVVNKTKGRCCGVLQNAIIYNNELQDLVLFQIEV